MRAGKNYTALRINESKEIEFSGGDGNGSRKWRTAEPKKTNKQFIKGFFDNLFSATFVLQNEFAQPKTREKTSKRLCISLFVFYWLSACVVNLLVVFVRLPKMGNGLANLQR